MPTSAHRFALGSIHRSCIVLRSDRKTQERKQLHLLKLGDVSFQQVQSALSAQRWLWSGACIFSNTLRSFKTTMKLVEKRTAAENDVDVAMRWSIEVGLFAPVTDSFFLD